MTKYLAQDVGLLSIGACQYQGYVLTQFALIGLPNYAYCIYHLTYQTGLVLLFPPSKSFFLLLSFHPPFLFVSPSSLSSSLSFFPSFFGPPSSYSCKFIILPALILTRSYSVLALCESQHSNQLVESVVTLPPPHLLRIFFFFRTTSSSLFEFTVGDPETSPWPSFYLGAALFHYTVDPRS